MSSILTMDTGLSVVAMPAIEAVSNANLDKLDWVNVMVSGDNS